MIYSWIVVVAFISIIDEFFFGGMVFLQTFSVQLGLLN